MNATFLKNRIYKNGSEYYCYFCNLKLINVENAVAHTTSDVDHLYQIQSAAPLKNANIDEDISSKLVDNGIIIVNARQFSCTVCLCAIPNIAHACEHINGKKHTTRHNKLLLHIIDSSNSSQVTSESPNDDRNIESEVHCDIDHNSVERYPNEFDENNTAKLDLYQDSCTTVGEKEEDYCRTSFLQKQVQFEEKPFYNHVPVINSDLIYCNSCHDYLQPSPALRYHRMFHLSQKNCNAFDVVSFSMRKNSKGIYCLICDCTMNDENDLESHLVDLRHHKRLIMFYYFSDSTLANMMYRSCTNATVPQNVNDIYSILEFNKYVQYMNYNLYQSASSAVVQTSPINFKFNQQSMLNSNVPIAHNQSIQVPMSYSAFPLYFCFICQAEFVDENLLYYHYVYDCYHKYRMEAINLLLKDKNIKFATFSNDELVVCTKCQIQMIDANAAVNHIFEPQHLMQSQIEYDNVVFSNGTTTVDTSVYVCPICKVHLSDDCLMIEHIESESHQKNVQDYYININSSSFEKIIFSCSQCNMNFFNDSTLLEHLYVSHEKSSRLTANTLDSKSCSSNDKRAASEETNLHNADRTLDDSVDVNQGHNSPSVGPSTINKSIEAAKYYKSSSAANRTKNLISFSQRYVKLCVESGEENIFKINPERVRLLKLAIYLTFPYKSGRACLTCGCEVPNDPQLLYEHFRTERHERNLYFMQENDEFFENYEDQFSDLELAKQYMYEDSDEWIHCYACDCKIANVDQSIRSHIESEPHADKRQSWIDSAHEIFEIFNNMFKNLWYYIEKFFCNICCTHFVFEVDYARHLESPQHLKEVENRILRKLNLQFDYCIICSYFWYARSDQYKIHCKKDSHKYILKSRNFTVPNMPDSAKDILTSVQKTVDDLILESDKVASSDGDVEKLLLESVEEVVKFNYPKAKAYLFGSRIANLGIKDSDLDIYLDCEDQYDKVSSIEECQEQLLIVQECFHKYQDIWIIEEIVLRTRVPIIKIRHRPTNLNCDISFMNGLSVEKSKVLSSFTNACLPCRKMILYLKVWNNLCQLSGKKGITTFAISWLVIFYLQLQGFLPSVWDMINLENQSNIIAGWETGVSKKIPVKHIDLSTKDLLKGFFSYYANFDYISCVASPYLGKVMMKSKFSHTDDLPDEMNIYKLKIKEEKVDFFRLDSPMCIQEPIDLSQNLTKAITKLHLRMFKQYCSESAAILQNSTSD